MSRVLLMANHFIGLYFYRKELIRKLCDDGHEVYLSLPEDDDNKIFEKMGCKIYTVDISRRGINPKNDLRLVNQYKKLILEIKPDIIFSYTIKPNIYGSLISNKYGYKQVCNVTGLGTAFAKRGLVRTIATMLYKFSVKNCYKVFFQNTQDRDYFIKNKMIKDNWGMLPGSGCNLEEYEFSEFPESDTVKFIFIARVEKPKGIDEYLACAKAIKEKYNNVKFYVAGRVEEDKYNEILEEYGEAGYIEYIGFRNDVSAWIKKCHCVVNPTYREGMSNVLLEAGACGRPVIASDIPGCRETFDEGVSGFGFQVQSTQDLIKTVEKFLMTSDEEKSEMGKRGREKIEKEFDRNIVTSKYLEEVSALQGDMILTR